MPDHLLRVGEEVVIEGVLRLIVLAVKQGMVVLGIAATELKGAQGPSACQRKPSRITLPVPSDN